MKREALLRNIMTHICLLREKHPRKAASTVVRRTVKVLSQYRRRAA
jgi:hypothetical protein